VTYTETKLIYVSMSLTPLWLWTIFRMTLSKSLPLVNRNGGKNVGNWGPCQVFCNVILCVLPRLWKMWQPKAGIKYMCQMYKWPSWKVPEAFIWNTIIPQAFRSFNDFINFCMSQGPTFSKGVLSAASSTAWNLPIVYGCYTSHAVWIDFLNISHSWWLSLRG
jgi:hypothetical protein